MNIISKTQRQKQTLHYQPNTGYSTLYGILAITIVSLLLIIGTTPDIYEAKALNNQQQQLDVELNLERAVDAVLREMIADPTPYADSKDDPVWAFAELYSQNDISVKIEDISTGLNLNTLDPKWLEQSHLKQRDLIFARRSNSFFRSPEDLFEYVDEDIFQRFYSIYGYVNPNLADTAMLTLYIKERLATDNSTATALAASLKSAAIENPIGAKEMTAALGSYSNDLLPILLPVASINVNMAERELLDVVITFPFDGTGFANPNIIVGNLMAEKLSGEMDSFDLIYLFNNVISAGKKDKTRNEEKMSRLALQFLGTKTWFWKITATSETGTILEVIAVRLPLKVNLNNQTDNNNESTSFQIVEKNWRESL